VSADHVWSVWLGVNEEYDRFIFNVRNKFISFDV
jgi:hypothetical protein